MLASGGKRIPRTDVNFKPFEPQGGSGEVAQPSFVAMLSQFAASGGPGGMSDRAARQRISNNLPERGSMSTRDPDPTWLGPYTHSTRGGPRLAHARGSPKTMTNND